MNNINVYIYNVSICLVSNHVNDYNFPWASLMSGVDFDNVSEHRITRWKVPHFDKLTHPEKRDPIFRRSRVPVVRFLPLKRSCGKLPRKKCPCRNHVTCYLFGDLRLHLRTFACVFVGIKPVSALLLSSCPWYPV